MKAIDVVKLNKDELSDVLGEMSKGECFATIRDLHEHLIIQKRTIEMYEEHVEIQKEYDEKTTKLAEQLIEHLKFIHIMVV
jgi:hypothetical protein